MSAVSSQAVAITVDQLFSAAFGTSRDPRSGEYMDGARAALTYRIEGGASASSALSALRRQTPLHLASQRGTPSGAVPAAIR